MAINEVTSIDVKTLPPFKRLIMTLGELPTSYLESMTYAELLMWFCNFLQEKVLPTINNNADALQEVITYLENLDLQDEVNNKLDEMAESGQLQEIIAEYLNANALWSFDNVAGMKTASNLIDGSFAKTLGYRTINDGGSATYKIRNITNEDTVDEMTILSLSDDTLIAELIHDNYNLKQLGCYGDNEHNDSDKLEHILEDLVDNGDTVYIPKGVYILSKEIVCNKTINFIGAIDTTYNMDYCVIKNINTGGIKFTATSVYIANIDFKGNGYDSNCYGIQITGSRAKLTNCSFGDFRLNNALYIGDDNEYHNVDVFNINNVFCYRSKVGCKIGSALNDNSHPELVDANAGTISGLSVQSCEIGLHMFNATVNNINSIHSENNDLGVKLENAFANIFVHPYLENTNDISFDERSTNNIVLGTRNLGYIEAMSGDGLQDNIILSNLQAKGIRNVWSNTKTQQLKIAKNGSSGYWDLIHDANTLKFQYPYSGGIISLNNSTNNQRLDVDYIKINSSSNTTLKNVVTNLGTITEKTLAAGGFAYQELAVTAIANDTTNWPYWVVTISFATVLPASIMHSVEVTNAGARVKFYNTSGNTITIPATPYRLLGIKHYI